MGPNPLIYFDSGASTLKHSLVTDRMNTYNRFESANVHRGAHHISRQGTEAYEGSRKRIYELINAFETREVIFTRGTTESVNLVASCFESEINSDDEVLISPFEHHSNIVPWQRLCEKTGAKLIVAEFDKDLGMTIESFKKALSPKTKIASFLFYSNSFGNRLPIEEMIQLCKDNNTATLVDAAQAVLTEKIDVQSLNCDFLTFSGHKMFGPYGVGICYINKEWLDRLEPYQTGGSMIDRVSFDKTTYAEAPQKFEAGTPNIAGAIGIGKAADVVTKIDFKSQHDYVIGLRNYLIQGLSQRQNIEVYNFPSTDYAGVVSFNVKGTHPSDVGTLLDKYGVAVRAGHHCTQPLMDLIGIPGTVRVSISAYNTKTEIDYFFETLSKVEEFF